MGGLTTFDYVFLFSIKPKLGKLINRCLKIPQIQRGSSEIPNLTNRFMIHQPSSIPIANGKVEMKQIG